LVEFPDVVNPNTVLLIYSLLTTNPSLNGISDQPFDFSYIFIEPIVVIASVLFK
jgi:hypothetical protein